jgi:hypothetical protein
MEVRVIAEQEMGNLTSLFASVEENDVVVAGGGSTGIIAAYAAARTGAKTALIERASSLGGTTTAAMISSMMGWRVMRWSDQNEQFAQQTTLQVAGGFATEWLQRLLAEGGAWGPSDSGAPTTMVATDPAIAQIVTEQMLAEAGVDIWFLTQLVDVVMEGQRVVGVVVANNGAMHLIRCRVAIDVTGDGAAAAKAGADFQFGRPSDNKTQPATLAYILGGVNFEGLLNYLKQYPDELVRKEKRNVIKQNVTPEMLEEFYRKGWPMLIQGLNEVASKACANGDFPIPYGSDQPYPHLALLPLMKSGRVDYSLTKHGGDVAFGVDPTNRRQMTEALIAAREFVPGMARFYRKYVPGYENSYLFETAPMLGVRESRRIIGDYMLTEQDVRECREFEDAVGINGSRIDVHVPDPGSKGQASEIGRKGWYHIPYRILLPKGIEGLLIGGRCASSDHIAHGSLRHQASCMVMGHAVGTAAAIAVEENTTPRGVDVKRLQERLRNQGAIIDEPLP